MSDYGFAVVHIPHASFELPEAYCQGLLLSGDALWRELALMTDAFTHELYDAEGFNTRIINPVSRFVCDVERFRDDRLERNAKRGQGLMYTRTGTGKPLREYDAALRRRILDELYDPHHRRLEAAVTAALEQYGYCLIIDGHSFNSRKIEKWDNLFSMPDFDIGTDRFHTPHALAKALSLKVRELGYRPRFNSPYGGAITPMKYYGKDRRVVSVMFETNRRLYMDEQTVQKNNGFEKTRQACHTLMRAAADLTVQHFGG